MFIFRTKQLLTSDELKDARQHIAWENKYIKNRDVKLNKHDFPSELKAKLTQRKQSLKEIAEAFLNRELGLKPYSVIRYINRSKSQHAFVIIKVELEESFYGALAIRLTGNKLRKDGNIGFEKESIALDCGVIERRKLDGSWHSIIPANPIWIDEI